MTCRFTDAHYHFDSPPLSDDKGANLQRAVQAGVGEIIIPAIEAENFTRVLALAENYQSLYATLGLHPGMLEKHSDAPLEQLQQALERRPVKVMAVGEIDLGLSGGDPQFERQQQLFGEQLKLAKRYDLPVILHSRCTHDKLAMHLRRHDLPRTGVVRNFSGSLQQIEWLMRLGYKIGVGGIITYPCTSKTRDVIAELPLASLSLETDAPDISLDGFQGQPNRPEQTAYASTMLYELRREPADEIAQALLNNTYTLFNMS